MKNQGDEKWKTRRGDIKVEGIEVKPSSSKEVGKIDAGTLYDKIGQLFEIRMKCMVSDLKTDIATNVLALKSDIETSVDALKSDIEISADALKTDIHDLKSDMATNAEKFKIKMEAEIKQCNEIYRRA